MRKVIHRMMFLLLGRAVEVSLSFASILLFSSFLVTPCVLVLCWLAWRELTVKKDLVTVTTHVGFTRSSGTVHLDLECH